MIACGNKDDRSESVSISARFHSRLQMHVGGLSIELHNIGSVDKFAECLHIGDLNEMLARLEEADQLWIHISKKFGIVSESVCHISQA